jgi:hypothetical protein
MSLEEDQRLIRELLPSVVAFDMQQAAIVSGLADHVKDEEISFGGRFIWLQLSCTATLL